VIVLYRLSPEAENVHDPADGNQITVYKLTLSIISKLSENMRYIDQLHVYLAIKHNPEIHQD
jgi:hypothetical protein